MKVKTGYRMVTKAYRIANPIVPKGALVDNGCSGGSVCWKESTNAKQGMPWANNCNYCVPKDFVFPPDEKKKSTKMTPFKAWAVVDKADNEALMPTDGEYVIDNHLLIYNTRKCARQAQMVGSERVVRVMVIEI